MVIKAYRIDSGFANVQDEISLSHPGENTIFNEVFLDLPDGFVVDEGQFGHTYIYDDNGAAWEPVVSLRGNLYQIVGADGVITVQEVYRPAQSHIKTRRENVGISIRALASAIGVSKTTIENIEGGKNIPSIELVRKIAKVLDCTIDEIWR